MEIITVLLFLTTVGLIAYIMFGNKKPMAATGTNVSSSASSSPSAPEGADHRSLLRKAENDLDKKRKEMEELKVQLNETKVDLKEARRRLHDDKETSKIDKDLVKARSEVEREASIQLDATRAELATALAEIQRMKADGDSKGRRHAPAPQAAVAVAAPVAAVEAAPVEKPQVQIQKVIRELSEADKEKMQRAEAAASKDRTRAQDLERDLRGARNRSESLSRQLKTNEKELGLIKDKFRALEKRSNRLMLQNDLYNRALKDIEKRSGIEAGRLELSPDELTRSDQAVEAKQRAEDQAEAEAQARLEAADAAASTAAAATEAQAAAVPAVEAPKTTPSA